MMGFSHGYVASVHSRQTNKAIREISKGGRRIAPLAFGSEYSIKLKNRNKERAQVEVFIDGTDVLFGSRIILNPGETIDLQRFVENDKQGKSFKFMSIAQASASGQLQDPDEPDNGKIEVKFYKELTCNITYTGGSGILRGIDALGISAGINTNGLQSKGVTGEATVFSCNTNSANYTPDSYQTSGAIMDSGVEPVNKGVTAEGSSNNQKFSQGADFQTELMPTQIEIWLEAPVRMAEFKGSLPAGYVVRFEGKSPVVYLNGHVFPGHYKVKIENQRLIMIGSGINVETNDFVVV